MEFAGEKKALEDSKVAELGALERELGEKHSELVKEVKREFESKHAELAEQLAQERSATAALRQQAEEAARAGAGEISQLKNAHANEIAQTQVLISQLREQVTLAQSSQGENSQVIQGLSRELGELKEQKRQFQESAESRGAQIQVLEKERAERESEHAAAVQGLEQSIRSLQESNKVLTTQLVEREAVAEQEK